MLLSRVSILCHGKVKGFETFLRGAEIPNTISIIKITKPFHNL